MSKAFYLLAQFRSMGHYLLMEHYALAGYKHVRGSNSGLGKDRERSWDVHGLYLAVADTVDVWI